MSATDRGLAYGDGVFRTFVARDGVPEHWRRHYRKLMHDCARLAIAAPDERLLHQDVVRASAQAPACVVKVIVTRGNAERGYRYGKGDAATRVVMCSALPEHPPSFREQGVCARTCTLRLAHQPALAGVKHLNRLENVLARAEWDDPEIAEGILYDPKERAIGGTMTNLFIVVNGRLITPDLGCCGVAGVTRDRVMEAAKHHGVPCEVRALAMPEVRAAEELFLVNSVIGIWPVRALDGTAMTTGEFTQSVGRWLEEKTDAQMA